MSSGIFIYYSLIIIAATGFGLTKGVDFGALHCQRSRNVDRGIALDLTMSAPIAANGCCR